MTQVHIKQFVNSSQSLSVYYVCKINHSLERETSLLTEKMYWWRGTRLTVHSLQGVVLQDWALVREKWHIIARISVVLKNEYIKQMAIINSQNILKWARSFFLKVVISNRLSIWKVCFIVWLSSWHVVVTVEDHLVVGVLCNAAGRISKSPCSCKSNISKALMQSLSAPGSPEPRCGRQPWWLRRSGSQLWCN